MTLIKAVVFGIIQGLTEFLPVSSSAHFTIFKNCFNLQTDTSILFDIILHLGTLSAILFVYFHDIKKLVTEFYFILCDVFFNVLTFFQNIIHNKDKEYRRIINKSYRKFAILILVSFIPAAVVGYTAKELAERTTEILIIPGILLIINGGLLLLADYFADGIKTPKLVTYTNSFMIGICQGISSLPGLSRSGMVISACLFSKFNRSFAVKYSFIMFIPTILGSSILRIRDINSSELFSVELIYSLVGALVAGIVGYICIKLMTLIVQNRKFKFFAIYCFLAGFLAIGGYIFMK